MPKKPNILWICSDQQRWDSLGCYGNPFVRTPNLDRLAAEGTLFRNAFCQSPVCTPSRGSFLTGRYPRTCRSRQNGADLPAEEILVTRLLSDAGYLCGLSGKLHLSACNPKVCPGTEERIEDGYDQFFWSHDTSQVWPTNEYYQWLGDRGVAYAPAPSRFSPFVRCGPAAEDHQTTWCAEKAISFIRSAAAGDRPWLFSVNMYDPHHPFDPPEPYLERYMERLGEIPLPNYVEGELDGKPRWQSIDHRGAYGGNAGMAYGKLSDHDHRVVRAAYWAMCDLIDEQVGRMLDALEATGQRDNTLIIFTSDHGEMLGDHGIYLKGPYFYEGAVHVPLIISAPRSTGAAVPAIGDLVELTDLAQTILDAAGLPHHPGMQGKSLWPLLTGGAESAESAAPSGLGASQRDRPHRQDVYCEYYNAMPWHRDPTPQLTMVRTDRYKLTLDHGAAFGELYDLELDPTETLNRWNDPEHASVKMDMLIRLADRMAFTADPLPLRRAAW